jgi:hypothetical protein
MCALRPDDLRRGKLKIALRFAGALAVAALVSASSAVAQTGVQSQRLFETTLPLDAQPSSSALALIWQDRLVAERQKLAALTKPSPDSSDPISAISVPVFEARFKDGDNAILVSVLFTSPECQNFFGASAPSLNDCPMRAAVLRNGLVKIVASEPDFPFAAALKETPDDKLPEYSNLSQQDKTIVLFNPVSREITTVLTLNGARDTEKAAPIHLAY